MSEAITTRMFEALFYVNAITVSPYEALRLKLLVVKPSQPVRCEAPVVVKPSQPVRYEAPV